jgi:hypothetical protein
MPLALYCAGCRDVVTPRRWPNGAQWRWCECAHAGIRRAGDGIEVTALGGPFATRVLALDEAFLAAAVAAPPGGYEAGRAWRKLHASAAAGAEAAGPFRDRDCWAVIIRPGDDGAAGVTFTDYCKVPESARPGFLLPELAS